MNENNAVAAIGDIDAIVNESLLDLPLATLMKAKIKPKTKLKTWEIVLIVLGFPLWFPLLGAFFAVILAVYASVWAVIISLYAAVASLVIGGIAGALGVFFALRFPSGLFMLGCGLFFTGTGILAFFGVKKLSIWLMKTMVKNNVSLESTSGKVTFNDPTGNDISLSTVSGDVSGNIIGDPNTYSVKANSVSGDIKIPPSANSAKLLNVSTTSGDIDITMNTGI